MEGTDTPLSFHTQLRVWLGRLDHGRDWMGVASMDALVARVHRAFRSGVHTADMGGSPLNRWLWGEHGGSAVSDGHEVLIGLLRGGRAGEGDSPRLPAPLGYVDVRVDRRGSRVGNPFKAGDSSLACMAYDLLLTLVLLHACIEDVPLLADGGDAPGLQTTAGSVERMLFQGITSLLPVQLASSADTFSSPQLLAWLYTHARLVARGQRLRLLCWCCDDGYCAQPGSTPCHARSLAALILWLAYHLNEGSTFESCTATPEEATSELDNQVHTRCPLLRCRLSPQPWHAGLLLPRGCHAGSNVSQRRLSAAPTHCLTVGPLNQQRQP